MTEKRPVRKVGSIWIVGPSAVLYGDGGWLKSLEAIAYKKKPKKNVASEPDFSIRYFEKPLQLELSREHWYDLKRSNPNAEIVIRYDTVLNSYYTEIKLGKFFQYRTTRESERYFYLDGKQKAHSIRAITDTKELPLQLLTEAEPLICEMEELVGRTLIERDMKGGKR